MFRYIRRISAIACLALCAFAFVFWMRSYHWINKASVCFAVGSTNSFGSGPIPQYRSYHVAAKNGHLLLQRDADFFIVRGQEDEQTGVTIWPSHRVLPSGNQHGWLRDFSFHRSLIGGVTFSIPLWFLSFTTAAAGTLLWKDRPYRFTLRGALVATTLVAVVLGAGVALSR